MPYYLFLNKDSGEEFTSFMSISELDVFLKENPNITQLVNGAPMVGTNTLVGNRSKPDGGFRDLLKDMRKKHSKGFTKSTINTF